MEKSAKYYEAVADRAIANGDTQVADNALSKAMFYSANNLAEYRRLLKKHIAVLDRM